MNNFTAKSEHYSGSNNPAREVDLPWTDLIEAKPSSLLA